MLCEFCGKPYDDHPQCPQCGYTYCDAQYYLDHRLCGEPTPKPPTIDAKAKTTTTE